MKTIGERIQYVRKLAGLTQAEFAQRLTVSRGAVGNWERDQGITLENLSSIARTFGISFNWLATSTGAAPQAVSYYTKPRVVEPIAHSFDPDVPDPVESFEADAPADGDPDQPPLIPANGIVEADIRPGSGPGANANQSGFVYHRNGGEIRSIDAIKPDPWIFPPWFLRALNAEPGDLMIAESSGDSMRPTIEPGMPLIIDLRHKLPSPDGIYAIRDRWGSIQAKRIETSKILGDDTIKVISDNGGHVQLAMSEDDIAIVGRVIGGWKLF